jgi:Arm DNA-binding domain
MALTPLEIKAALPKAKTYRLALGGSLFLVVHPSGSKSYEFRYRRDGKRRAVVLGDWKDIGLKEAQKERDRLRGQLVDGLDPLAQRRIAAEEERAKLEAARTAAAVRKEAAKLDALTVKSVADAWVLNTRALWTSGSYVGQRGSGVSHRQGRA